MPPLLELRLPPPSRDWVEEVLEFANMELPDRIQAGSKYVLTMRDVDNAIEQAGQREAIQALRETPTTARLALQKIKKDLRASEARVKRRSVILRPDGPLSRHAPSALEPADAAASQRRLNEILEKIANADTLSVDIEESLKAHVRNIQIVGSAAEPQIEITTLDQWWAFPLAALSSELIGRLRRCGFVRCKAKYFVDWPGRPGGQPKLYCSPAHEKAQNQQRVRDKRKADRLRKETKAKTQRKKRTKPGLRGAI